MPTTAEKTTVPNISLMLDSVLANLPAQGLRSVLRGLISSHPDIVGDINSESVLYLKREYAGINQIIRNDVKSVGDLQRIQKTIKSFIGCRLCFESLGLMTQVLQTCLTIFKTSFGDQEKKLLLSLDSDIAQALSLVLTREAKDTEISAIEDLFSCIKSLETYHSFGRSHASPLLHHPRLSRYDVAKDIKMIKVSPIDVFANVETFTLGERKVPRVFCGLWQLSSSAWGTSSLQQILDGIESHVQKGFSAFDMADIYGDVEVIFGEFRKRLERPEMIFAATKYCTFNSSASASSQVELCISERLQKLKSDSIDLLQLHWQNYGDSRYLEVLRSLQNDTRVSHLGLCNFDTEHMEEILNGGIDIKTNQVQFSLIDSRPTIKIAALCEKHDVKLLTYGSLCGGFLSDSWLGKPEPGVFSEEITPSQRKYFEMIVSWGGWSLFQELLATLSTIANKHKVSVSNVATRWVLDFPYVGAVIIGARMGISERTDDNLAVYGWRLSKEDQAAIEKVLAVSRRKDMFLEIGDCGTEHR